MTAIVYPTLGVSPDGHFPSQPTIPQRPAAARSARLAPGSGLAAILVGWTVGLVSAVAAAAAGLSLLGAVVLFFWAAPLISIAVAIAAVPREAI